jgi:hypothetical protein
MATKEERLRILQLVQDGKITPDEASQLIEAIDVPPQAESAPKKPDSSEPLPKAGHWFRVKVTNTENGKTRVNVRLPVSLVKAGMKMGARFSPEVEQMDLDQITEFINSGEVGQVIEVFDEDGGDHVEVFIE